MKLEYQIVVDFFFREGKMFFYAFVPSSHEVVCESDDFESVFLKLAIGGYDLQKVSFNKVSMLDDVLKVLATNGIELPKCSYEQEIAAFRRSK